MIKNKFKFITSLATCACLLGSVFAMTASASVIRGDVNGDGKIDISDSVMLNKFLSGIIAVKDMTPLDFDGNCIISRADNDALLDFIVGR